MATNQSVLEQMLQAALSGGGLREKSAGAPAGPASGGAGNLGEILGSLLGGTAAGTGAAAGRPGTGEPGGLGDILGSILGGASGEAGNYPSGAPGRTSAPTQPAAPQPSADAQRQGGTNALAHYGGLAVIGVLAYQAYKRYQAQQTAAAGEKPAGKTAAMVPPPDSGFNPGQAAGGPDALAGLLVKSMVAATQSDGAIDEDELRRFAGRLDQLGIGSVDRNLLAKQLTTSVDPREIVNAATSPELALQAYAASVLAVAVDTPAERKYFDGLASALGIDPKLKAQLEQTLRRG